MTNHIYVIELDKKVLKEPQFKKANPDYIKGHRCFYVGQTGKTPEQRFKDHKDNRNANSYVRDFGIKLIPKKYKSFNPIPTLEAAEAIEKRRARKLRKKGYGVWPEFKPILYIDMDNVLVDFQSGIDSLTKKQLKEYLGRYDEVPNIFSKMKPIKGALKSYKELSLLFDTYILSTSPWENKSALGDKLDWVKKNLGKSAYKRLIFSHHKNLNKGDFLIDDRKANGAGRFSGIHIHFKEDPNFKNWKSVVEYLKKAI